MYIYIYIYVCILDTVKGKSDFCTYEPLQSEGSEQYFFFDRRQLHGGICASSIQILSHL